MQFGGQMTKYVRLCKTVNSPGLLVPLEEVNNTAKLNQRLATAPNSDWYTSVYYFGDKAKEYFNNNGNSVRGYKGEAYTENLIFDFDAPNLELEDAKKDVVELLARLKSEGVDVRNVCTVYFSGNKGFHVQIPTVTSFVPEQLKVICSNIAKDLKTFDPKVYNTTRLFRLVNTKHQDTGLYKIPLDPVEFYNVSISDIKNLASKPRNLNRKVSKLENLDFIKKYSEPEKKKQLVVEVDSDEEIRGLKAVDFSKCPKTTPRCIFALQQGVMKPGERNEAFLRLAAFYKNQGMDKKISYRALKGVAELNSELYPDFDPVSKDEIWHTVINSVYAGNFKQVPGATGASKDNELLARYCSSISYDRPCSLHAKNKKDTDPVKIDDVSNSFSNFAENFDKNLVYTGINLIDDNMKIAIGTTTLLVGASGCGKTTLALNIMENANALGQHTMFFSLDMHKNLVYLKLAQKVTDYNQDEILAFYQNKQQDKIEEIKKAISDRYSKTYFDFSGTLTMEQMRDKIFAAEEKHGTKIKLVVVDYASRISGQYSDSYANARDNALKSTTMANETDAAWIIISQVSRQTGNGQTPLRTKRAAKESGDWEESATNVLTVWRPFMGDEHNDDVIRLFLAKNRMGKELERPLWWSGSKGMVWDMSEEDYMIYKEERERIEVEASKKSFSTSSKS